MVMGKNKAFKCTISLILTIVAILNFGIINVFAGEVTKVTFGEDDKQVVLQQGTYLVPAYMRKSADITSDSMAAGCLTKDAKINIDSNGNVTVYLEMRTLNLNDLDMIFGNATGLYIYDEYNVKSNTKVANVDSERIGHVTLKLGSEPKKEVTVPEVFSFNMPYTNHSGLYAKTDVDAMGMSPDVYIEFDFVSATEITDTTKLDAIIKEAKSVEEIKYTLESYKGLQNVIKNAEEFMKGEVSQVQIDEHITLVKTAMEQLEIKKVEIDKDKIDNDKNNTKDKVSVKEPTKPQTDVNAKNNSNPKTGDEETRLIWLMLVLASAGAFGVVVKYKKKIMSKGE